MPRVEVLIQVIDDEDRSQARSSFQVGNQILQGTNYTPFRLAHEVGELFRDTLLHRCPNLGHLVPEDIPVSSSTGGPIRRRSLVDYHTPLDLGDAFQQEVDRLREENPVGPQLPRVGPEAQMDLAVDMRALEYRVLSGLLPEVSMDTPVGADLASPEANPVSSQSSPNRPQNRSQSFQRIYGGNQFMSHRPKDLPPPPSPPILTRYQRKPVI